MRRFNRSIEVQAPPDRVFSYLADPAVFQEWSGLDHYNQVDVRTDDHTAFAGLSLEFEWRRKRPGITARMLAHVTLKEVKPNEFLAFEVKSFVKTRGLISPSVSADSDVSTEITLEPVDGITRITLAQETIRMAVSAWLRIYLVLMSPILRMMMSWGTDRTLRRIKARVEQLN